MKGVGKSNINIGQLKKCIPEVGNNNPELTPVSMFIWPGWLISGIYSMVKPFLHPNTLKKIVFVKEGPDLKKQLNRFIPDENLPEEFGGWDTEFASLLGK